MRHAAMRAALVAGLLTTGLLTTSLIPTAVAADRAPSFVAAAPASDDPVPEAKAEVIILHGTNSGEGIDPKIGDLPQLKEPPFSSYDSYKLLERADQKLTADQTASRKLPNDGKLELTLQDVQSGKKGKRYSLEAAIKDAKGKDLLPSVKWTTREGEYVFLAGPKYKKGILVIGIRIAK